MLRDLIVTFWAIVLCFFVFLMLVVLTDYVVLMPVWTNVCGYT